MGRNAKIISKGNIGRVNILMILVLLGTQSNSFVRLLDEIENCIKNKIITDKVVVQCGHTRFSSDYMELLDFIPVKEFNSLIEKADLIITHGGVGSIINSIKAGKKIIAVPRLSKFNEHVNDHQIQIIQNLDKQGCIKGVLDVSLLPDAIKNIDEFIPKPYIGNKDGISKIVSDFIDNN